MSVAVSTPLSPCESGTTILNGSCAQFNASILRTYLETRQVEDAGHPDLELVFMYNESTVVAKLSAVANLINTFATTPLELSSLTMNHLIIYLYYNQIALIAPPHKICVNQFTLVHCGRSFKFTPQSLDGTPNSSNDQTILKLHNITQFNTFHLLVQDSANGGLNVYQYFNAENYLQDCLRAKPSVLRKVVNRFKSSGALAGQENESDPLIASKSNREKPSTRRSRSLRRLFFR